MKSRLFDGSGDHLEVDSSPSTGEYPVTLVSWFKADDITDRHVLVWIGDKDVDGYWFELGARGDLAGDPIRAFNHAHGGTLAGASTAGGYTADVWQHAAAVFVSTSDRTAYLDGVGTQDTASGPNAPVNWDRVAIGYRGDDTPSYNGGTDIADAAIYLAELTTNEILALTRGARPNQVRPESLVFWAPIIGESAEPDWSGGKRNLTVTGATVGNGPPVAPYSARFWGRGGPLIGVGLTPRSYPRGANRGILRGAA